MNVYDAMGVLYDSAELPINDQLAHDARRIVGNVVDAYDALAPDWDELSHGNAEWYVIEPNGDAYWCPYEPTMKGYTWTNEDTVLYDHVDLPLGIDWRLCKWSREVTK